MNETTFLEKLSQRALFNVDDVVVQSAVTFIKECEQRNLNIGEFSLNRNATFNNDGNTLQWQDGICFSFCSDMMLDVYVIMFDDSEQVKLGLGSNLLDFNTENTNKVLDVLMQKLNEGGFC